MNLRFDFTADSRINELIDRYPIEEYCIAIKFQDTIAIAEPWLGRLLINPYVCQSWLDQDSQDLIEIDVDVLRSIAYEHGLRFVVVELISYADKFEISQN